MKIYIVRGQYCDNSGMWYWQNLKAFSAHKQAQEYKKLMLNQVEDIDIEMMMVEE